MNSTIDIMASATPPPATITNMTATLISPAPAVPSNPTARTKGNPISPIVIIVFVIALVLIISICIHRILRYFCHHSHHVAASFQLPIYRTRSAGHTPPVLSDQDIQKMINSLPVFTLASSMAKLRKSPSSLDCAVCFDKFLPDAELRLLPACCHAFHKSCADKWLKSNPSCPLCRSSITLPFPPLLENGNGPSESFRLELGNINVRRSEPNHRQIQNQIRPAPTPIRTYSLESHDYCIEEELEIQNPIRIRKLSMEEMLERRNSGPSELVLPPPPPPPPPPRRAPPPPPPPPPAPSQPPPPPPPAAAAQPLVRQEAVPRGWLGEFLDRLSSVSSSFNSSTRFPSQRLSDRWSGRWSGRWSQRSSQRFEAGGAAGLAADAWLYELEEGRNEETGGVVALYRWLVGV